MVRFAFLSQARAPLSPNIENNAASLRCEDVCMCTLKRRKVFVMMTGNVRSYDEAEGFGFIQPDDGGRALFIDPVAVEHSGPSELVEEQKVAFDTFIDRRSGTIAVHDIETA
jgi:CspA family cold shock protein